LNPRPKAYESSDRLQLLNTLSVTEISELSKLSKAYISQVKHGNRPPSKRLLENLTSYNGCRRTGYDYFTLFLQSRKAMEGSPGTEQYRRAWLGGFREGRQWLQGFTDLSLHILAFCSPQGGVLLPLRQERHIQ